MCMVYTQEYAAEITLFTGVSNTVEAQNYEKRAQAIIEHLAMLVEAATGKVPQFIQQTKLMPTFIWLLPYILNRCGEYVERVLGFTIDKYDETRRLTEEELSVIEYNLRHTKSTIIRNDDGNITTKVEIV